MLMAAQAEWLPMIRAHTEERVGLLCQAHLAMYPLAMQPS